jgi:hypothetical protein
MKSYYVFPNPPEGGHFRIREVVSGGAPQQSGELLKTETELREMEAAAIASEIPAPTDAEIYAAQQALGYLDATTGLKLKATENAKQQFTSQVTLLQLALSVSAVGPSSPVEIWDYNNAMQTLPLSDFMGLMLRYGLHCQQLFKDYAP